MTPADFHEDEIEQLRQRWELGDLRSVMEAFALTAWRARPFPEWLTDAVLEALVFAFNEGGSAGRGKGGRHIVKAQRRDMHEVRHGWAEIWLRARDDLPHQGYAATRDGAFAFVSELLRGTFAQGSAKAIERSFDKIQRETRRPDK